MHETTLKYEASLVRQGVRCYWKRTLGARYWLALLMLSMSLTYLSMQQSIAPWVVVMLLMMLVAALSLPALLYVVHYRSSMGRFRRMDDPTARFIVDAETFGFSSSLGETKLKWDAVKGIWKCADLWLIQYVQGGFNVLPVACMPEAMRDFIEERVKSVGGKVDNDQGLGL